MAPTQTDIDAADGIAEILAEVGIAATIQFLDGNYDPSDGDVGEPTKPVGVTLTPPLRVAKELISDIEFEDTQDDDGMTRDIFYTVYADAAAFRVLGIDAVPLLTSIVVNALYGTVVKAEPIFSGTLNAAWKLTLRA